MHLQRWGRDGIQIEWCVYCLYFIYTSAEILLLQALHIIEATRTVPPPPPVPHDTVKKIEGVYNVECILTQIVSLACPGAPAGAVAPNTGGAPAGGTLNPQ